MSETIQIQKDTFYKVTVAVLGVLLIISIFTGGFGVGGNGGTNTNDGGNNNNGGTTTTDVGAIINNPDLFPSIGPSDADVTVIELADYQCPYCALASGLPSWSSQYQSQYGDLIGSGGNASQMAEQGQIRFIYVPLSFLGEESTDASQAAYCAGDQEKYFEMHDAIFTASTGPTENDGKYSKANLKILAQSISGLDQTAFNSCLDSDKNKAKVQQATTAVQNAGFQISTPQFWVNEQKVGASWTAIQAAINAA
ncbi:MAG: thioredoxin domain-containing protein [archaeon]|nr:thioredoxin domain-containing protein [archaeon]